MQVAASVALGAAIQLGFDAEGTPWLLWLVTSAPIYGVGLLLLKKLPTGEYETKRLKVGTFLQLMLIGIFLMYTGNLIGTWLSGLLSGGTAQNALNTYVFDTSPLKILVMVVLAPLLEELFFRKAILDRCSQYGEQTAILFSGLTFGLFHMNLFQFFYAFALGLLFAYVYVRTRKLRYPVAMHMVVNFMGSVLAPWAVGLMDAGALDRMEELALEELVVLMPEVLAFCGYLIFLLGATAAGWVLFILKARKLIFRPAPQELPRGTRFKTVYCNLWMILFVLFCVVICGISLMP